MSPESKIIDGYKLYREGGIDLLAKESYAYLLKRGPPAPYMKRIFGKQLHQQLLMYPRVGYWPQIEQPRSFNEHLMHRKLYTDNDLFVTVEDKWQSRGYVQERIGKDVLPEVYHVTSNPETIPFQSLPDEFVIKPTHLSGPVEIVDNNKKVDGQSIKQQCRKWLDKRHGTIQNEYWYSEIEPQIIIEERLYGAEADIPRDFKFFVFNGNVEYVQVDMDRNTNHSRRFYDMDWNPEQFELEYPLGPETPRPSQLETMISVAETLGSEFDFIRVDLYETAGSKVKFGEMTVAPGSGGERFEPVNYDFVLGTLW